VNDADLAALAVQHRCGIVSFDNDFARCREASRADGDGGEPTAPGTAIRRDAARIDSVPSSDQVNRYVKSR